MRWICTLSALLLAACATIPEPLRGDFPPVVPEQVRDNPPVGQTVRWGGSIIQAEPGRPDSCVEILARPLEDGARPRATDENQGRFLACSPGFLEPETFRKDRDITVVGEVSGTETRRLGDYDYVYPVVQASALYLWAPRVYRYYYPYPDPFWGWGPYWGPAWGGRYGYPWFHQPYPRSYAAFGWYFPDGD